MSNPSNRAAAMHRTKQRRLPVVLRGAGLRQWRSRMGNTRQCAKQLFDFRTIGPLPPPVASLAIEKPLRDERVRVPPEAVDRMQLII